MNPVSEQIRQTLRDTTVATVYDALFARVQITRRDDAVVFAFDEPWMHEIANARMCQQIADAVFAHLPDAAIALEVRSGR